MTSARRFTLHDIRGEEFPSLPQRASLAQLIARTHFSISTDETRLHLNSGLFEWACESAF